MALHLIMSASYNALLAILLYILDKKTVFSKVTYKIKQIIIIYVLIFNDQQYVDLNKILGIYKSEDLNNGNF